MRNRLEVIVATALTMCNHESSLKVIYGVVRVTTCSKIMLKYRVLKILSKSIFAIWAIATIENSSGNRQLEGYFFLPLSCYRKLYDHKFDNRVLCSMVSTHTDMEPSTVC